MDLDQNSLSNRALFLEFMALREKVAKSPSERIPFFAPPSVHALLLLLAIWKEGKIAVPLNPKDPALQERLFAVGANLFSLDDSLLKNEESIDVDIASLISCLEEKKDSLATMLFTSGSSGKPKLVCHQYKHHIASAKAFLSEQPMSKNHRWHLLLPLYHVSGLSIVFRCYLAKAVVSLGPLREGITHASMVPTQWIRQKERIPKTIEFLLLGGAPIPNAIYPEFVHRSYGMTETSSLIALDGKVLSGHEVRIEKGEILIRSNALFCGYFDLNLGIVPASLNEGWFPTKDCGFFDENGRLQIRGRKDRQFIVKGENVQPEEVELQLKGWEGISEVVVQGRAHAENGMEPILYYSGKKHSLEAIQHYLKSRLTHHKIPVEAVFVEDLSTPKSKL